MIFSVGVEFQIIKFISFSTLKFLFYCLLICVGFFFKDLFIYLWLRWVFVAARGLSLVVVRGGYSSLRCAGFSLQQLLLLQSTGSRCMGFSSCGSGALECRLSSCGAWAYLLGGMWNLPRPGLEPMSPELAGRFLTTAPSGKPCMVSYEKSLIVLLFLCMDCIIFSLVAFKISPLVSVIGFLCALLCFCVRAYSGWTSLSSLDL